MLRKRAKLRGMLTNFSRMHDKHKSERGRAWVGMVFARWRNEVCNGVALGEG